MAVVLEPGREVRVAASADVVIAGGGIAGVAAALAAARTGAETLLLEKECALGGLATLGLIVMYLPLCDGKGHQVIGGIGEELLRKSVEHGSVTSGGHGRIPDCWNGPASEEQRRAHRFRVDYDAAPMMLMLERLLREAGVKLWYDTRLCAVQRHEKEISHILVENKSGRLAIAARAFVDATGDADLCALGGEETEGYLSNRRSGWYFSMHPNEGARLHPLTDPLDGPCPPGSRYYRLSGSEVSAYVEDMHDMIRGHAATQKGALPLLIPALPLMRMTRRLCGRETLTREDLGRWRTDAVAMTGDWRRPAPVYTIAAWIQVLVTLALLIGTVRSFRTFSFPIVRRNGIILALVWSCFLVNRLSMSPIAHLILELDGSVVSNGSLMALVSIAQGIVSMILLSIALTLSVRMFAAWRASRR